MKRSSLSYDPARGAERRKRREARRQAEGPRPEDTARDTRRAAREELREASRRAAPAPKRQPISVASPEQRAAVAGKHCLVCPVKRVDPAHLIPVGVCHDGDGDPRAVVPLCRTHHRAYDTGELDLLPYLEPTFRVALAFAVERYGLIATMRRVTNTRSTEAT